MDPRDKSVVNYSGMKFVVDWKTKEWRMAAHSKIAMVRAHVVIGPYVPQPAQIAIAVKPDQPGIVISQQSVANRLEAAGAKHGIAAAIIQAA